MSFISYFSFRGLASRKQWWKGFLLFVVVFIVVCVGISWYGNDKTSFYVVLANAIVFLLVLLPVSVRRLHDAGHSGFWSVLLVPLAFHPIIGPILISLYLGITASDKSFLFSGEDSFEKIKISTKSALQTAYVFLIIPIVLILVDIFGSIFFSFRRAEVFGGIVLMGLLMIMWIIAAIIICITLVSASIRERKIKTTNPK